VIRSYFYNIYGFVWNVEGASSRVGLIRTIIILITFQGDKSKSVLSAIE